MSGFVINMWERTVHLTAPIGANDEHPTGERVYETASFLDGAGLEEAIRGMIERRTHAQARSTS